MVLINLYNLTQPITTTRDKETNREIDRKTETNEIKYSSGYIQTEKFTDGKM